MNKIIFFFYSLNWNPKGQNYGVLPKPLNQLMNKCWKKRENRPYSWRKNENPGTNMKNIYPLNYWKGNPWQKSAIQYVWNGDNLHFYYNLTTNPQFFL